LKTLHEIEEGNNETSTIADLISIAVPPPLKRWIAETSNTIFPRKRDPAPAFLGFGIHKAEASGALYVNEGKKQGCWVTPAPTKCYREYGERRSRQVAEEDQKVIVRSNGTVGYVGKDIAYHMWKFTRARLCLSCSTYPNQCWISANRGEKTSSFGDAGEIYMVIDASIEAQSTVIDALRGLGYNTQADHYTHFSYEMVALTPRCAAELGYMLSEEDQARSYIEVSGRKGFGVKADDLLDRLIASAREQVDSRHPELSEDERNSIATQIAIGALRYFMLKYTKPSVIAFDFRDALSFEGEPGPYVQYAAVRATTF
jgi:arginyl-tRNA synthetase